jgi:hypothetical protein
LSASAVAAAAASAGGGNYKLFSELAAINKLGSSGAGGAQMGSGSGLTGDDNAILELAKVDLPGVAAADTPQLNTLETSAGEDAAAVVQPPQPQPSADAARRKGKHWWREQQKLSQSYHYYWSSSAPSPQASEAEQANKMQPFFYFRQEPRVREANRRGIHLDCEISARRGAYQVGSLMEDSSSLFHRRSRLSGAASSSPPPTTWSIMPRPAPPPPSLRASSVPLWRRCSCYPATRAPPSSPRRKDGRKELKVARDGAH